MDKAREKMAQWLGIRGLDGDSAERWERTKEAIKQRFAAQYRQCVPSLPCVLTLCVTLHALALDTWGVTRPLGSAVLVLTQLGIGTRPC